MKLTIMTPETEYIDFNELCWENGIYQNNVIISGNTNFRSYGDETLINITHHDYFDNECAFDYDIITELNKITGKDWQKTTIKGYSQGDWQNVYYTDNINKDMLYEIECFYFNKVKELVDEDYCSYYVPDDIVWKGKIAVCEYLNLDPNETTISEPYDPHTVYKYRELD